jgi:hypothetical protein
MRRCYLCGYEIERYGCCQMNTRHNFGPRIPGKYKQLYGNRLVHASCLIRWEQGQKHLRETLSRLENAQDTA